MPDQGLHHWPALRVSEANLAAAPVAVPWTPEDESVPFAHRFDELDEIVGEVNRLLPQCQKIDFFKYVQTLL